MNALNSYQVLASGHLKLLNLIWENSDGNINENMLGK